MVNTFLLLAVVRVDSQKVIKAYLVLRAQAFDLQALGQLVEAAMQVPTELHQVLDVEDVGKVDLLKARHDQ